MPVSYAHITVTARTNTTNVVTVSDYAHVGGEMPLVFIAWRAGSSNTTLDSVALGGNALTRVTQSGYGGAAPAPRVAAWYTSTPIATNTTSVVFTFSDNITSFQAYIIGVIGHHKDTPIDSSGATETASGGLNTVSAPFIDDNSYTFSVFARHNGTALSASAAPPLNIIADNILVSSVDRVPACLAVAQNTISGVTERGVSGSGAKGGFISVNIRPAPIIAPLAMHHYIMQTGAR